MSSNFDQFVDELDKAVMEEMRRDYSAKVVEIFLNPANVGKMDNPDFYGKVTGSCGDTMEIFLKTEKNLITDSKFTTDGCGPSLVCGSMITQLVKGKYINEAGGITAEKVLDALGGLPEADQHCAQLAEDTLQKAITTYLKMKKGQV